MKDPQTKTYDLEDRLVTFAVRMISISESLTNNKVGNHVASQLIRSGTSPALNYGEAQSAESKSDFIHKFRIILKELRESSISLKIIRQANLLQTSENLDAMENECGQLIAIFTRSIQTARGIQKRNAG